MGVCTSMFHVLLFLAGVCRLAVDVVGGGKVDDRVGRPGLIVQCGAADIGSHPVSHRMHRLRCDFLEQAVTLRLVDAELPPLGTCQKSSNTFFQLILLKSRRSGLSSIWRWFYSMCAWKQQSVLSTGVLTDWQQMCLQTRQLLLLDVTLMVAEMNVKLSGVANNTSEGVIFCVALSLEVTAICPVCGREVEDSLHVFCVWNHAVWLWKAMVAESDLLERTNIQPVEIDWFIPLYMRSMSLPECAWWCCFGGSSMVEMKLFTQNLHLSWKFLFDSYLAIWRLHNLCSLILIAIQSK